MARPVKCGVDYFPHDVNCLSKKTVYALDNLYGNDGYAFWWKLLELLGQQRDLSFRVDNRSNLIVLVAKTRVSEQKVIEILDFLCDMGAIDPELWQKRIIWCQNFVDRLAEVFRKRNIQLPSKPSFCDENPNYRDENPTTPDVIPSESTQSKVKESKVNIPPLPPEGEVVCGDDSIMKEKEVKETIDDILSYFGFNEIANFDKFREASCFVIFLKNLHRLNVFRSQFSGYKAYKDFAKEKVHGFKAFLGSPEKEYLNGGWNAENWGDKLKRANETKAPPNAKRQHDIETGKLMIPNQQKMNELGQYLK